MEYRYSGYRIYQEYYNLLIICFSITVQSLMNVEKL